MSCFMSVRKTVSSVSAFTVENLSRDLPNTIAVPLINPANPGKKLTTRKEHARNMSRDFTRIDTVR